jgi:hypothetical protein
MEIWHPLYFLIFKEWVCRQSVKCYVVLFVAGARVQGLVEIKGEWVTGVLCETY